MEYSLLALYLCVSDDPSHAASGEIFMGPFRWSRQHFHPNYQPLEAQ